MITAKLSRDSVWQEWVVKVRVDGVRKPDMDYHTDDKKDAIDTMNTMVNESSTVLYYTGKERVQ